MTRLLTPLINEDIDSKYSRIHEPFGIYSDILGGEVWVPVAFVHDYESVPVVKGTSKRGGVVHDYLSRYDSVPIVTKKQAADVYFEIMEHRDGTTDKESELGRVSLWIRRWIKYGVVRVWPCYFHKHKVMATYEEMSGSNK